MKKYILNNTPTRTSNNYGINDISLELDIPTIKDFNNVMMMSYEMDDVKISDMLFGPYRRETTSKIGLTLDANYCITITIPKNVKIKTPINLLFNFDEENNTLVDNIRIVLMENATANFILNYKSRTDNIKCFHHLKQETIAGKNSKANITIANLLNNESNSFIATENTLNENAKINYTLIELGGNTKISNYYAKLKGDTSENNVKSIYLGTNNDLIDINYNIEAHGKRTKCNIESIGALSDKAHKNFKGTIDFKKGSAKSVGIENENCMLLSENAKSKSLPMLLCHEEDVNGQHGVSSGKIDESKLFYIMTRGISYEEAKKLIVKANFNNIIKTIEDENLQKDINLIIDKAII